MAAVFTPYGPLIVTSESAAASLGPALSGKRRGFLDRFGDRGLYLITLAAAIGSVVILGGLAYKVVDQASSAISTFGLGFLTTSNFDPVHNQFGAAQFIYGTAVSSFGALLLATPLSIAIALFLTELAPRGTRTPIATLVELLAGIPSVILGLWGILAPLGALVFSEVRSAARWYVAWLVVFLGSGIAGEVAGPIWPALPGWFTSTMLALNIAVGGTIVFTLLAVFASQRRDALAALRVEQEKAEDLLLNILPRSIADRLKAQTGPIADQFESASILFADVVDFTPWSERLAPSEVVGYLDHLFSHFDALAERYELEKIKTIGDCYMVAAGVPTPRTDHARALALMALDMLEAMRSNDELGHLGLELRAGINSGPVVAGVIGRKRFLYDLWGDVVNTASRMESYGAPGRIQITRPTYELLADEFECEPRGTITVKGKGEVEAWYLIGLRGGHRSAVNDRPRLSTLADRGRRS